MVYVIIIVVLILVIVPIFSVLPSKRQKEQMALRRIAMSRGFSVELTRIDDPDPDPEKYVSNTGKPLERVMNVIAYRLARNRPHNWRRLPQVDWCLVRRHDAPASDLPAGWAWEGEVNSSMSPALRAYLVAAVVQLPADVVRVEEQSYLISAYWNEHGGEAAVNAIIGFIQGCAEQSPWSAEIEQAP